MDKQDQPNQIAISESKQVEHLSKRRVCQLKQDSIKVYWNFCNHYLQLCLVLAPRGENTSTRMNFSWTMGPACGTAFQHQPLDTGLPHFRFLHLKAFKQPSTRLLLLSWCSSSHVAQRRKNNFSNESNPENL